MLCSACFIFIESGTPADGVVPPKLRDLHCSLGSACTCSSVRLQQVGRTDVQMVGERLERAEAERTIGPHGGACHEEGFRVTGRRPGDPGP